MRLGTSAFHESSSTTTPSYDFVARPKGLAPPANSSFAGVPLSTAANKPLAQAFVPEKAPGLSSGQKVLVAVPLLAVAAVLAVVVGGLVLRAYDGHVRASTIRHTSIQLPRSIAGMARKPSAQAQAAQLVAKVPTPTPPQAAAYAATRAKVGLVFAAAYAMPDSDRRDYLASSRQSAAALGFTLSRSDAGPRGGQMWCGSSAKRAQTFCAFADVAAYGAMIVPGTGSDGRALALTFRSAVEARS
jgi:hypothetical protein